MSNGGLEASISDPPEDVKQCQTNIFEGNLNQLAILALRKGRAQCEKMVNIETNLDRNKQRQTTTIIGICRSSAVLHRQKTMGLQTLTLRIYMIHHIFLPCVEEFLHQIFLS